MFDWALARQVKDDLVLVLPNLHGDLEQLGDDRRGLIRESPGCLGAPSAWAYRPRSPVTTCKPEQKQSDFFV
jgi:hypothetical protein